MHDAPLTRDEERAQYEKKRKNSFETKEKAYAEHYQDTMKNTSTNPEVNKKLKLRKVINKDVYEEQSKEMLKLETERINREKLLFKLEKEQEKRRKLSNEKKLKKKLSSTLKKQKSARALAAAKYTPVKLYTGYSPDKRFNISGKTPQPIFSTVKLAQEENEKEKEIMIPLPPQEKNSRMKRVNNTLKHIGHRIGNAGRKFGNITKKTFNKMKDTKRLEETKVKIKAFLEYIKDLIKKFIKKSELNPIATELLKEELNEELVKENNITQSQSRSSNRKPTSPKKNSSSNKPSFYNNEIQSGESKIREITERIDNYIKYNNKYVTINDIENYYNKIDGKIAKDNTNAKKVIDHIKNKLVEIDNYLEKFLIDEKVSKYTFNKNFTDLDKETDSVSLFKQKKKASKNNIKEILLRFKRSSNQTMYDEINTLLTTHFPEQ